MEHHLTSVRMAVNKKKKKKKKRAITGIGKDVEKREPLCTFGKNVNWCSHNGKQYGSYSKNEKQSNHMTQQSHFWVYIQRKFKKDIKEILTLLSSL